MEATVNGKTVTADSIDELEQIASRESKDAWIYGADEKGQFGFCNDPDCTCDKFMRYD